nr:MAG TPA: hypothetical protein [Caudoviricetes sp.]
MPHIRAKEKPPAWTALHSLRNIQFFADSVLQHVREVQVVLLGQGVHPSRDGERFLDRMIVGTFQIGHFIIFNQRDKVSPFRLDISWIGWLGVWLLVFFQRIQVDAERIFGHVNSLRERIAFRHTSKQIRKVHGITAIRLWMKHRWINQFRRHDNLLSAGANRTHLSPACFKILL